MIWPEWATRQIATILVIDNLASVFHVIIGFFACIFGCGKRLFWVFFGYQLFTTIMKILFIPGYPIATWQTDLIGDTLEYVIGVGFAYIFNLEGKLAKYPQLEKACSWKAVTVMLGVVMIFWAIGFILALQGKGGL